MAFTNLFVSGLPDGLDDESFRQLFEAYGSVVSTKYVPDRRYGFVKYASPEEAETVIASVDGFVYNGSKISVRPANDRTASATPANGVAAAQAGGSAWSGSSAAWSGNAWNPAWAGSTQESAPSDNLYIKGLPPNFTDEGLQKIFGSYGTVTQTRLVHTQAVSNDPAGESIALVRMGSVEEAQWLVDNLNGNIPLGLAKPILVKFAETAASKASRATTTTGARYSPYGGGGKGGTDSVVAPAAQEVWSADGSDPSNLYVKDLPPDAGELYLYKVFAPLGAIESVYAVLTPQGTCAGIGFVKYVNATDAANAIAMVSGQPLSDGTVLTVSVKKPKRTGAAPGTMALPATPTTPASIPPPPPARLPPSALLGGELSSFPDTISAQGVAQVGS